MLPLRTSTPGAAALLPLAAFMLQLVSCGGASTAPPAAPGLRIVSLSANSDTVMALPSELLVVEVRGQDGAPAAGTVVEFTAPPATGETSRPVVFVCAATRPSCAQSTPTSTSMQFYASAVTDAAGRASARIQHGIGAGSAAVTASVPQFGFTAAATFTTRAGAIVGVTAMSRDTALYVGTTATLAPAAADRFGNPHGVPTVLESLSPNVVTATGASITAIAVGRAQVVARTSGVTDTLYVSVVPSGRLVIGGYASDVPGSLQLVLASTDGSARRRVALTGGHVGFTFPSWTRDGRVLFTDSGSDFRFPHVFAVDTVTGVKSPVVDTTRFKLSLDATYPGTGGGMFFYGVPAADSLGGIFHAPADGSVPQRIASGGAPSVSPDGTRVAYVRNGSIVVHDLATGAMTAIASTPHTPFWSPAGNLIAYVVTGESNTRDLWVVAPDGSGRRIVTAGIYSANSWSPDGEWIATVRSDVGVEIIRVADGLRIPIPRVQGAMQVSWGP